MNQREEVSRRSFLKDSAAAGAAMALSAAPATAQAGAAKRVTVGVIGCGGIGTAHLKVLVGLREQGLVNIAAVCDVYEKRLNAAQGTTGAEAVKDYRRILDRKDVDAVLIATPDHWHAPMTIQAADARKDIYCEKPMTYWKNLQDAKDVVAAVARNQRVMQVGTNGLSDTKYEQAQERISELGTLMRAQASDERNGPIRLYSPLTNDPDAVPGKTLDWDLWLGPAPKRPYQHGRYFAFRAFWDYSGGICSDLFPHLLTPLISVMGLDFPKRVVASGGLYHCHDGREVPDMHSVMIEYASGPSICLVAGLCNDMNLPMQIQGQQATITFDDQGFVLEPQVRAGNKKPREAVPSRVKGSRDEHWKDFLHAIETRQKPRSHEVRGLQVMTAIHMGVRSYREGKVFEYNAAKEEVRAL